MPAEPVFILGIAPRSGTNYLSDLLCVHPDCAACDPIFEDYLIHHSQHLAEYVGAVSSSWRPGWGVNNHHTELLWASLGDGLARFLTSEAATGRVVTKTPSTRNLAHFFQLFPNARLLVLIRDGRAVVESAVRSFGVSYEWWMRQWATSAGRVIDFERNAGPQCRYHIVRFEALWENLSEEMSKILEFVELDATAYDYDKAANLPVRGSSEQVSGDGSSLSWEPLPRSEGFDPTQRWSNWQPSRLERFNWIAGKHQLQLGYETRHPEHRTAYVVRNFLMDMGWLVMSAYRAATSTLRTVRRT